MSTTLKDSLNAKIFAAYKMDGNGNDSKNSNDMTMAPATQWVNLPNGLVGNHIEAQNTAWLAADYNTDVEFVTGSLHKKFSVFGFIKKTANVTADKAIFSYGRNIDEARCQLYIDANGNWVFEMYTDPKGGSTDYTTNKMQIFLDNQPHDYNFNDDYAIGDWIGFCVHIDVVNNRPEGYLIIDKDPTQNLQEIGAYTRMQKFDNEVVHFRLASGYNVGGLRCGYDEIYVCDDFVTYDEWCWAYDEIKAGNNILN